MSDWSEDGLIQRLRTLFKEWSDCDKCEQLCESRLNLVFGNGNPSADIMMIGEAPGGMEDETGATFVGRSGQLLTKMCEAAGIDRTEEVFCTNAVMCRPPGNRDPVTDEMNACYPRLSEQIYIVDPMLIIPVGGVPTKFLMGSDWKSITKAAGQFGFVKIKGRVEDHVSYVAMPILHPSYILREDHLDRRGNWDRGGLAYRTVEHLKRAKERVNWLKEQYRPVTNRLKVLR